jgi:hypothetical protein
MYVQPMMISPSRLAHRGATILVCLPVCLSLVCLSGLPASLFFFPVSRKSFQIINQTRQNNEFRFSWRHFWKNEKKTHQKEEEEEIEGSRSVGRS